MASEGPYHRHSLKDPTGESEKGRPKRGSWGQAVLRMGFAVALAFVACLQGVAGSQQTMPLTAGMVIERSITVRPGVYRLASSADLRTPAITIRGAGITVD